jgi:hypothetical protein
MRAPHPGTIAVINLKTFHPPHLLPSSPAKPIARIPNGSQGQSLLSSPAKPSSRKVKFPQANLVIAWQLKPNHAATHALEYRLKPVVHI